MQSNLYLKVASQKYPEITRTDNSWSFDESVFTLYHKNGQIYTLYFTETTFYMTNFHEDVFWKSETEIDALLSN